MPTSLDYNANIDLNDPSVQHTLGTRIQVGTRFDADSNPLSVMRGRNSEDLQDTTEFPIQVFTVGYKKGGRFTKFAQETSTYKSTIGDRPLDADDTESYKTYSFTVSPLEIDKQKGLEIGTQFKNGIVSISDMIKVEHHMMKYAKSTLNEMQIAKLSGRCGMPSLQGWSSWMGDEIGGDRTTSAAFKELNANGDFYQNSDIFNPSVTDYRSNPRGYLRTNEMLGTEVGAGINPVTESNGMTEGDRMSYSFLKDINSRLKVLQNEQFRGIPFTRPMMNTMEKYDQTLQTGGGNRLMAGGSMRYTGALILSEEVINDLKDDDDWIRLQRAYTEHSGTLSGIFTGIVGDMDGMKICSMLKMVQYKGGVGGNVDIHRGLVLGAESAVEVLCNFPMIPEQMMSNVKTYQKQYMNTPSSVSVRVNPTNTGKKQSIWMSMYYNIVQASWETNFTNPSGYTYDRVSNVIAVDVATSKQF